MVHYTQIKEKGYCLTGMGKSQRYQAAVDGYCAACVHWHHAEKDTDIMASGVGTRSSNFPGSTLGDGLAVMESGSLSAYCVSSP